MTDVLVPEAFPIPDYLAMLRRRKGQILLVAAAILAVAVAAALLWPPSYQSLATILIEEPDVPNDLVRSTVSDFADQRLQIIQQRAMTTQNLINIIDKYGLYAKARQSQPVSLIVDEMRKSIGLELISADANSRGGAGGKTTIAFTLSFDGPDPVTAQQVANELVTLYLSENQRARQTQASDTASFLADEAQRVSELVRKLETELAQFKAENAGSLPEKLPVNTQLLNQTESQLLQVTQQLQSLRERQAFMQSQLASIDPYAAVGTAGATPLDPEVQLKSLQAQYSALSAKYGTNHPDVIALRRQIDALKASVGDGSDKAALEAKLESLKADLTAALQKYGPEHPDVKKLKREIQSAQESLASLPEVRGATPAAGAAGGSADNPIYIQLEAQLAGINVDINAAKLEAQALQKKAKELEARIFKTPEVERAYAVLTRDHDAAVARLTELRTKQSEADLAQNLEAERMGEKLSVIEPPNLPVEPVKPNRPLILGLGLFVAAAGSIGSGLLADLLGGRVYRPRQLAALLGHAPLAVVPRIRTAHDRRRTAAKAAAVAVTIALILAGVALYLQRFVAPLDVVWAALLGRLGLS
jgi:polysaccharide biosynthesis transport protein